MVLTLRQRRKIVEPLYRVHSSTYTIAACDSMVLTLRQRRKIVEPLYHKYTFEKSRDSSVQVMRPFRTKKASHECSLLL